MKKLRILIVEDDGAAILYSKLLDTLGHSAVGSVSTGEEAIRLAQELPYDLIITDVLLAGSMSGIRFANMVSSLIGIPVIVMGKQAKGSLEGIGASPEKYEYLQKPFSLEQLGDAISRASGELYDHAASDHCSCASPFLCGNVYFRALN